MESSLPCVEVCVCVDISCVCVKLIKGVKDVEIKMFKNEERLVSVLVRERRD